MKPSDLVEDVAIVGAAIAGSSFLLAHPEIGSIVAIVTVGAAALAVALARQGD